MKNKQQQIDDVQPLPAGEKYEAVNYKVTFLKPDTAVMTHSTNGTDAHYSLHVWSRKGGHVASRRDLNDAGCERIEPSVQAHRAGIGGAVVQ